MTHAELLANAIEQLRRLEARCKDVSTNIGVIKVDKLLKRRVRDAVVIYFDGDDGCGHIQAVVDCETGAMIKAEYAPAKERGE